MFLAIKSLMGKPRREGFTGKEKTGYLKTNGGTTN